MFSKFIREKLIDDIISKIDKKLNFDQGHKVVMGARWKRAKQTGYNNDEKSKLISTYLARAKSLIPSVRDEVRRAALGKTIKTAQAHGEKIRSTVSSHKEINGGRSSGSRSADTKDYRKMTDMEILNS